VHLLAVKAIAKGSYFRDSVIPGLSTSNLWKNTVPKVCCFQKLHPLFSNNLIENLLISVIF